MATTFKLVLLTSMVTTSTSLVPGDEITVGNDEAWCLVNDGLARLKNTAKPKKPQHVIDAEAQAAAEEELKNQPLPGIDPEGQALQDALATIAERDEEIAERDKQITAQQQTIAGLEAQLPALQQQLTELEGENKQLQESIDTLEADKTKLQGQVDSLTEEKAQLHSQVDTLTADKAQLQGQVTTLEAENKQLQERIDELEAQLPAAGAPQ